ncbi:MAG: alcohol dehydrogenase [Pseudomonadota bacterium]|jgi:choline dehydrogenase
MSSPTQFDTVVVGAGTAGCLLANRLSADPQHRVLLIEAGRKDNYPWIHIPVGYLYCIGNPRTDWLYQTEPDPGLNGRRLRYPRGKTLGGCSSINGMIYMRGQARDYDQWAALTGDDAWRWTNCLPDFKAHEHHHRLDTAAPNGAFADLHGNQRTGSTGEWRVEKQRLRWDILDAFAQAAQQAGLPATDDFNCGDNEGVGYFEVNQKSGWRWNASKAFLRPVQHRPNLTVWTEAQVQRLSLARGTDGVLRCTGAQVRRKGEVVQVHAQREVVLSAGSIGSVQILQLSGIGPAEVLRAAGVAVQQGLTGVGENLQDHLQIRSVYQIQGADTLNVLANRWWGRTRMGLEYLLKRSGPMSMSPSQLGAFTKSDPLQPHANLEYHVQPLSLDAFGEPLHPFPAFTASVCNLNPSSRGHVRIRSPNADDPPAIAPCYLSTAQDRQVAVDSLRVTRRIVSQPALAPYQPVEFKPGAEHQSDEALARLAGDIASTIFHPVGTTKMGRDSDPMAVLDSHCRVRGVRGLRVVDAGVMPTITSGNTNSPTLMVAEKVAAWMRRGQ